jgi:sterol desaturase/sphingolipid hydroxylase (fatty acid hydroxylase superfamily)
MGNGSIDPKWPVGKPSRSWGSWRVGRDGGFLHAEYMLRTVLQDALKWYSQHAVVVFAIASITAFVGESIYRLRRRSLDVRESTTSLASAAVFLLAKNVLSKLVIFGLSMYVYQEHRMFTLNLSNVYIWVGIFFLRDFIYYWVHRTEHKIRVLWASHMIHHSPDTIGFATAIRVPWMEAVYKPWLGLWVPLLGFNPVAFIVLDVLAATIGQLQHTTACRKRTLLDEVFVTPSAHRVHHASNTEYLDKNFGAVFIVWDRLFGTYVPETTPVVYGLVGGKSIDSASEALVGGYPDLVKAVRKQTSFKARAAYLFAAP